MSRGDIIAGKAYVALTLRNELARGLASAQQEVKRFANQVNDVGRTLAGFGAAITGPLLGAAYHFAKTGDELDKMSARTGVAVEQLSALKFAAEQSGAGLGEIGTAMKAMQQRGFDPRNFKAIADEISAIEDPVKRASRTIEVFGRSGMMLAPMLGNFRELSAEAEELGIVMSTEQATSAAELTDAMNRTKQSVLSLAREIGAAVAPELKKLAAWIKEIIPPAREWIENNKETIVWLLKIGGAMTVVGGGMMILGKVILGTSAALGALKTAILLASKASMLLYANPVLLGLAAVAAAVVVITLAMKASEAAAQAKQRALEQATAAAGRDHEAGQKMRAEDIDRLKRLEQLAEHQQRFGSLTTSQTEEAATIVGHLNGRYEGLGLTFDETTGKVGGLAGAMNNMVDAMRQMTLLELDKQLAATQAQMEGLHEKFEGLANNMNRRWGNTWFKGTADDVQKIQDEMKTLGETFREQSQQRERLAGGGTAGIVAEDGSKPEGVDTIEARTKHAEDMEKRMQAARLAAIEDTQAREFAAAKAKYQEERNALRDQFADETEFQSALAELKEATEAELANVRTRYRKQQEAEEQRAAEASFEARRRFAEQQAAEEKRRTEGVARETEDLQKQIARQTLEMQHKDDPDAQRRALMELEHKWQMEAIAARTDLTAEERQNMTEMQEHLHGLKKDALDAGKVGAAGRPKGMGDITGHSAARAAAIAYGTGQGPQERMAAGIDRMAERLDEVADAAQDQTQATQEWAAAIQQWLAGLSYA